MTLSDRSDAIGWLFRLLCKGLWVGKARIDTALRCYAATDISRLCNPAERAHFGWLVAQYVVDDKAFN